MTPLVPPPAPPHADQWVAAQPFRAHAWFLLSCTNLPWPVLARASGLSVALIDSLLHGRPGGRPLRRLRPHDAARLLALDASDLSRRASAWIPVDATADRVGTLLRAGWDPASLAHRCGLSLTDLTSLSRHETPGCSQATAWLAEAASEALLGGRAWAA